jgi:hypothetical protein
LRYFREALNRRNVTLDVKHFEDCEQLFLSVGRCYLVEALLDFFGMESVDGTPKRNDPFPSNAAATCEEKKIHLEATLGRFVAQYILEETLLDDDDCLDDDVVDPEDEDGVMNYSINLLKSFMILMDYKDAVASGNGEHLALLHKQMIPYFFSVSYNAYAIEMLVSTMQNEVTLSPAEAHHCKWAALANWKGGQNKNIEIDLLQENRNRDLKGLIKSMGANKTEKAIQRVSKAAGGVRKIVDTFEQEVSIRRKSSSHSHKSAIEDEDIISRNLSKMKPFTRISGRSHPSFVNVPSDPLQNLDKEKFSQWLKRHQKNISLHFPTVELEASQSDDDIEEEFDDLF